MKYDEEYYAGNAQDKDRPALWYYYRLWRRYCVNGPVLDFGCGVGHLARRLSRDAEVYGIEINPYAIAQISNNAPLVRLVGALNEIPDESVASIISLHVLEHISDSELDDIGKHFLRILRPGGRIIVVMPDFSGKANMLKGPGWLAFSDPTHINLKGSEHWRRYFTECWNVSVIKCGADGYYDFPYSETFFGRISGDVMRAVRTVVQFLSGTLLLNPGDGEAVVFVLEKRT